MDGKLGTLVIVAASLLVLAIAMAAVPVMLKLVIGFQIRMGNGELPVVRFFNTHHWQITWGLWGLYLLGLGVALPVMIKSGFFTPAASAEQSARAPAGAMPPLEYQVRHARQILLCRTEIRDGAVEYEVLEVLKQARPVFGVNPGYTMAFDTSGFESLGYRPEHDRPVVFFLGEPDATGNVYRELIPAPGGTMVYPPYPIHDPTIEKTLTLDDLRRMVAAQQ